MSSERDKLRETIIKDTELLATKQRFALFSQPVPLGLGDDSYDFKLPHPRTADGKPVTEPPNVKVAHPKSGKVKSSYFSVQNYTTIGDPYLDHSRIKLQEELKKMELQSNKDAVFKPASGYKELVSGAFPHMADFDAKPTKNYKTPDGRVWSAPKNITTNPYSKQMQKFREHQKDEYERAREMERQRLLEAKRKEKEQPFRSTIAGGENFNRDKQVYGIDKLPPKSQRKERDLSAKRTDIPPFRPSNPPKKGYNGYMNKIVYMQDPEQIKKRVDKEKTKEAFRPNNLGTLSRPTPTISCYKTNIRRQMSAKGF